MRFKLVQEGVDYQTGLFIREGGTNLPDKPVPVFMGALHSQEFPVAFASDFKRGEEGWVDAEIPLDIEQKWFDVSVVTINRKSSRRKRRVYMVSFDIAAVFLVPLPGHPKVVQ